MGLFLPSRPCHAIVSGSEKESDCLAYRSTVCSFPFFFFSMVRIVEKDFDGKKSIRMKSRNVASLIQTHVTFMKTTDRCDYNFKVPMSMPLHACHLIVFTRDGKYMFLI